jgi:hypothetical protein
LQTTQIQTISQILPIPNIPTQLSTINNTQNQMAQNQVTLPDYNSNKPNQGYIKIYIKYQNQNKVGPYSNQIIDYNLQIEDTYEKIKQLISNNINFPILNIKLIPHPQICIKNILNMTNGELTSKLNANINVKSCDFIIAEIYDNIQNVNNLYSIF